MKKRTFRELKRSAREFLTGNYATPILAALLSMTLPSLLITPFSVGVSLEQLNGQTVIFLLAFFIIAMLSQLLSAGIKRVHLLLAKKQQAGIMDIFYAFKNHPDRYLLGSLFLFTLILVSAAPVFLYLAYVWFSHNAVSNAQFFALVIPLFAVFLIAGSIINLMYSLILLLYMDNPDMSVTEGLRKSRALMRGNKMRLFLLLASFIGWEIPAVLSFGIGSLWITPYRTQTTVNFYLELTGQLDETVG